MARKIFFCLCFSLAMPFFSLAASFDNDLFVGLTNNSDVTRLQEFLESQKIYTGPKTGNFFSLTREAVKRFQVREGISPQAGYFGPKTRARANALIDERGDLAPADRQTFIDVLVAQIKALQVQLEIALKGGSAAATTTPPAPVPTPAPTPTPTPPPPAPTPTPAPTIEFRISGGVEATFPPSAVNPLKIGDITLKNNLSADVLLSQVVVKLSDQMNSATNRGREVFFIIRKGTTTSDEIISSNRFTFNSTVPLSGTPHVSLVGISLPYTLKTGEEKTFGFWVDNFEYVISGTLTIEFDSLLASTSITPIGNFRFVLTRP